MNREQIRARNKETLNSIINNANIAESAKQEAIQNMIQMTAIAEKENATETLLQARGFADPGCEHHGRQGGCCDQCAVDHRPAEGAD